ncbi:MAG: PIG-L family deacetylase, partial [Thermoanaerobaculia bacterium]
VPDEVPEGEVERRRWLGEWYAGHLRPMADRYRRELIQTYGEERGREVEHAEVFEVSEYASPLDGPARRRLFPFLPGGTS